MSPTARRFACAILSFAILTLALPPAALAARDWTAVASTGAIDGSSLGFFSFSGPTLTYLSGSLSTAPVIARYNVTNTFDNNANPDQPGWTALELGYTNPAGAAITATLFQVDPCTGVQVALCTVNAAVATNTCSICTFTPVIDFSRHLYYVQVTLTRPNPGLLPVAKTLRIF
jgi:hypothetical protein